MVNTVSADSMQCLNSSDDKVPAVVGPTTIIIVVVDVSGSSEPCNIGLPLSFLKLVEGAPTAPGKTWRVKTLAAVGAQKTIGCAGRADRCERVNLRLRIRPSLSALPVVGQPQAGGTRRR